MDCPTHLPLSDYEELLSTSQLEVGMTVVRIDIPWKQTQFPLMGFRISDDKQVEQLQVLSSRAVILKNTRVKPKYGKKHSIPTKFSSQTHQYNAKRFTSADLEITQEHHHSAKNYFKRYVSQFVAGQKPDFQDLEYAVEDCLQSLLQQRQAMMWMTRIKNKDEYTVEHSINVSILCMAVALQLGKEQSKVLEFGLTGMLHDVGKIHLDKKVLYKPGPLDPEEYKHVQQHSQIGYDMLSKDPNIIQPIRTAVLQHHERVDGKGYPLGLQSAEISVMAKVVAIADAFDAMTSQRVYNFPKTTQEALATLHRFRGTQFDEHLVSLFTDCVGIYPEGSIVELTSGEVAIVISVSSEHKLLPMVLVILDKNKKLTDKRVMDLNQYRDELGFPQLRIKTAMVDGSYGIFAKEYYSYTATGNKVLMEINKQLSHYSDGSA